MARRLAPALLILALLGGSVTLDGEALADPTGAADLQDEADRLLRELARIRGTVIITPAPRVVVRTRDERRRFIVGEMARKYPPARQEAERQALVAWRLLPEGFDLGGFLTDLILEQAAAYYDPLGKTMVLAPWLGPAERREALTHELVHVLQDRQIDLERFLAPGPGRSDEALARQALVEGEAVALTLDLGLRHQGQELALLPDVTAQRTAILDGGTGPFLSRAPRFLRAMLTGPYAHGLAFVHHVLRGAGSGPDAWTAVSRLYRNPPRSTSDVLRPAAFLSGREDPPPVPLPEVASVLGPRGRLVISDQLGDLVLREILELPWTDAGLDEWRGDRYALWRDGAGSPVLLAATRWQSEQGADSFARLYAARLRKRHGRPPTPGGPAAWRAGGRVDLVLVRRRLVLTVEGLPENRLAALQREAGALADLP